MRHLNSKSDSKPQFTLFSPFNIQPHARSGFRKRKRGGEEETRNVQQAFEESAQLGTRALRDLVNT